MGIFKLKAPFSPSGDQPQAIKNLCQNIKNGQTRQTLLGVTGSGKTYTMANIIAQTDMPALIMSPNKVLAAQLYAEFKQFFPENSVEYFISYYDYYQPEAYIPQTDTYIEKDSSINEHIEQMRLKATTSLLTRNDVIVIASVSSIYNIGSPDNFAEMCLYVKKGIPLNRVAVTSLLIKNQYERSEMEFTPGKFRLRGGNIDILPPYRETGIRIEMGPQAVNALYKIHPITGDVIEEVDEEFIYPAKHFVVKESDIDRAIKEINEEKEGRVKELEAIGKPLEAYRLKQRTEYDMEMLKQTGFCKGIENYSRPLAGREPGSRPDCLFDYFRKHENFLVFIDESHVAVPQVRGMYNGDRSRKQMLIDFGFRLPSALDNRPLKFDEFEKNFTFHRFCVRHARPL